MIRLKLNLPEATVNYNETGALLGCPVEHTPNQIKNYGLPFEITGYVSKNDFLAYSLYSSARKFTVSEQISLLTSLGFKTIPYFETETGQGNQLITIKNQYSMFGAYWISLPSGKEFKIPEIAHINAIRWKMGNDRTLVLEATTDKGVYEVIDMKLVAYYQPGCTAKVWNGELQPMNTAPVISPAPAYCPRCNNPLKRVQIYPDLPLFYKCTSYICDKLVSDEEEEEKVVEPIEESSVTAETDVEISTPETEDESVVKKVDTEIPEEVEKTETNPILCYVDEAKVDKDSLEELLCSGKISTTDDVQEAEFILVKSKLAVSKNVRNLSKEFNKELKPISDFE